MTKTIILPSCDDGNRGDQALVWRTREIAEAAGLADECMMLTDLIDESSQSRATGIGLLAPILRHPSYKFSPKSNMRYGKLLFLIWGAISVADGARSLMLLFPVARFLFSRFMPEQERKTLREIKTADACFVKGGGFIHTTSSFVDPYKAYFFLYHVILAQSMGKKVYVMPNSFGPLKGSLYQWIVRRTLSRCELVTSRETVSQDMLEAIGIKSALYPDLAFGLESEIPDVPYLQGIRARSGNRQIVGITARPYRFPGVANPQAAYTNYLNEMATFAKWLFSEGYFPVFIEHVVSSGEHESDISAINVISDKLENDEFAVFKNDALNCRQLKAVYGECDYVVGTRFHSVIFALSEGTPALAIGYGGNKGRGIMRDIGMPEFVLSIENFTSSETSSLFSKMVVSRDLTARIHRLTSDARAKHEEIVNIIRVI